jgi:hypothetical protein
VFVVHHFCLTVPFSRFLDTSLSINIVLLASTYLLLKLRAFCDVLGSPNCASSAGPFVSPRLQLPSIQEIFPRELVRSLRTIHLRASLSYISPVTIHFVSCHGSVIQLDSIPSCILPVDRARMGMEYPFVTTYSMPQGQRRVNCGAFESRR